MKTQLLKIGAGITFLVMVVVNALANILPINNVSTGEVSERLHNLFAPAGITFSIWGLIYILLALYVVHQFSVTKEEKKHELINKINVYFIVSSLANIAWIFLWHHFLIGLTLIPMIVILICLIKIANLLRKESFSKKEAYLIKIPFSIYFGWITVATIANITGFLVSINWNGFGLADQTWAIIILSIGAIIGIFRMFWDKSIVYGLVFVWAYFGIYIKHISPEGFGGNYISIIFTTLSWMTLFVFCIIYLIFLKKSK